MLAVIPSRKGIYRLCCFSVLQKIPDRLVAQTCAYLFRSKVTDCSEIHSSISLHRTVAHMFHLSAIFRNMGL